MAKLVNSPMYVDFKGLTIDRETPEETRKRLGKPASADELAETLKPGKGRGKLKAERKGGGSRRAR
jgi:hypothetical protein